MEDGEIRHGKLLLELVHACPSDYLVDFIVDLRQYLLEVGLHFDEALAVAVGLACLLYNLLEQHFVASNSKGRLKQLIFSYFVRIHCVLPANLSDILIGLYEFLQELLSRLCVEDIVRVQLEERDEFLENGSVELFM